MANDYLITGNSLYRVVYVITWDALEERREHFYVLAGTMASAAQIAAAYLEAEWPEDDVYPVAAIISIKMELDSGKNVLLLSQDDDRYDDEAGPGEET